MNFNLIMECRENAGESLLSLSNPGNHVAPLVLPHHQCSSALLKITTTKPLSLLGQGELPTLIFVLFRSSSQQLGFTWTLKLCHIFSNGKPKRKMNLEDDDFFDALISVTKEIKGSQYGVQIESAVRDRLAADDKYEEEEEALEKVLPIKVLEEGFCHHIPSSCNFCRCRGKESS
ncbi:hypothetical protein ACFX12_025201 [Malus domestica]